MDKEKELAELYKQMIVFASKEQDVISIVASMIYAVIQKIMFQSAHESGYDMDKLKGYLDEAMKEFAQPVETEEKEN